MYFYQTSFATLYLQIKNDRISALRFHNSKAMRSKVTQELHELPERFRKNIEAVLSGKQIDSKFLDEGAATHFQKKVWSMLRTIPFGQVMTYAQVADAIGRPGAARAVGMSNRKNPLYLLTPCHRVVGAGGRLKGFAPGLEYQVHLLENEGWSVQKDSHGFYLHTSY